MGWRHVLTAATLVVLGCGGTSKTGGDAEQDTAPDPVTDITETSDPEDEVLDAEEEADVEEDAAGDPEEEAPPADCPVPGDLGPGRHDVNLSFGGADRHYIAYVTGSYDDTVPTPLIVNMHGYSSNAWQQILFSDMNTQADSIGYIAIYPDGLNSSWNAGSCCGRSAEDDVDDVGFLKHVVEDASTRLCIDRSRVYATGMSNGGYMAHRLGCEASDVFAAVAPVAGAMGIEGCSPPRPVPIIAYHGIGDSLVAYGDGSDAIQEWLTLNGCTLDSTRTTFGDSYCDTYSSCDGGVEVALCTLDPMGHCWPGGSRALCLSFIGPYNDDIEANQHMWDFMSRFTQP
jgi:polyhydroxybutyrate depolymerase